MNTLLHLAVLSVTFLLLSRFFTSVRIRSARAAVVVAIAFSVLNFFLGFVLSAIVHAALFVPALLTLGLLFLFVPLLVNAILLWLTDKLLASFQITSLGGLFGSAAVITLVNGLFLACCSSHASYLHMRWV
ncbi:MAG TPA: phage holin family protein [Polyangiaceae bacterium]|nr:phage holin family protein [Polyangiaceae bacterium]